MTIDEHGFASYLHHSNRCTTSLSLGLGQSLLIKVSPLFSIRQLSMGITELGQVKGSNFLSLLHLLLIRISHPTGLGINLRFKLTNPSFHLVHGLLSSLESIGLGIIKPGLHILDLALKQLAVPLKALGHILLIPEFISKASSINHGLLGLVIRQSSFRDHLIQITMESLHLRFQLPLSTSNGLVGASLLRELFIGVRELLLSHTTSPVRLFQEGPGLFQGILSRVSLALIGEQVVTDNLLVSLFIFKLSLSLPDLLMILLDSLLGILVGSIGMFQSSVKLRHIRFKLLLHPKTLSLTLGLLLKSSLHGVNCLLEVLASASKFFLLLSNAPLNLLSYLSKFKLSTQNLVLFLFQCTLSFFQGSLQLHLLSLKALPDLVNLMDGPTTFTDLIHDILDLIAQDLVLLADLIKLQNRFLISRLDPEEL